MTARQKKEQESQERAKCNKELCNQGSIMGMGAATDRPSPKFTISIESVNFNSSQYDVELYNIPFVIRNMATTIAELSIVEYTLKVEKQEVDL